MSYVQEIGSEYEYIWQCNWYTGWEERNKERCRDDEIENWEGLRKRIILKDNKFSEKVEVGRELYELIGENQINQKSLDGDRKEALDICMQEIKDVNVEELQLRPCQKWFDGTCG